MRSATRWPPCCSLDHRHFIIDIWIPARRSSRRAQRTYRCTTSHGRRRRFTNTLLWATYLYGPLTFLLIALLYLYLYISLLYNLLCLRTRYITAYFTSVKSAVMTAVATRSPVRLFVYAIFRSFVIYLLVLS